MKVTEGVLYTNGANGTAQADGEESFAEYARNLSYGGVGGLGLNIPVGSVGLRVEGRYHYGVNNQGLEAETYKAREAMFLAGLTLGGGK
jgi:hypothetical protein